MPKKSAKDKVATSSADLSQNGELDPSVMMEGESWKMDSTYTPRIIGVKTPLGKGHWSFLRQICMFRYFMTFFIHKNYVSY